ncbi:hypothetical protein BZA05DRAFT_332595 [Tricharina praecox]|uniref:uncharacterized protein n=1 Tax=Tricharina praecox TaxID=43433 RepID=UPI00221FEDE4|nr:uncharacterized protein BZA05DRAFT_332595 [Tricharina praecox]KAI5856488.1 hypothetical protein BZA05DRAFT_332595 [Tricharina praecox]
MTARKVWVKRCNASPTSVLVTEEDLVDDVRDLILGKYQNTLGRHWDAPDVQVRIVPRGARPRAHDRSHERGHGSERILSPDESLLRVVEEYFPGGQHADDALIIEVPERKTPRPSPGPVMHSYTYGGDHHVEPGYFDIPPRPVLNRGTPDPTNGGRVAPIPSPQYPREPHRPQIGRRMATSPPVQGIILAPKVPAGRSRGGSDASAPNGGQPPPAPPLKTVPSEEDRSQNTAMSTPARVASPLPIGSRKIKDVKQANPTPPPASGPGRRSDGTVPPIKVLIVEDNVINLRLLEAFMKRLKVRWEAAMNGKIAVDKWRAGGFHLVLMDIQLPVMNGLDATKEIRRLEKVNRIRAAFPHTKPDDEDDEPVPEEIPEADRLPDSILFRSPVIIVALTASSLQSDRHEAYAAGCNDFLTKPVNFIWLERKVTEWGCMQALIDFDGWKTWKKSAEEMSAADATVAKNKRLAAGNKTKKLKNNVDDSKPTTPAG